MFPLTRVPFRYRCFEPQPPGKFHGAKEPRLPRNLELRGFPLISNPTPPPPALHVFGNLKKIAANKHSRFAGHPKLLEL